MCPSVSQFREGQQGKGTRFGRGTELDECGVLGERTLIHVIGARMVIRIIGCGIRQRASHGLLIRNCFFEGGFNYKELGVVPKPGSAYR